MIWLHDCLQAQVPKDQRRRIVMRSMMEALCLCILVLNVCHLPCLCWCFTYTSEWCYPKNTIQKVAEWVLSNWSSCIVSYIFLVGASHLRFSYCWSCRVVLLPQTCALVPITHKSRQASCNKPCWLSWRLQWLLAGKRSKRSKKGDSDEEHWEGPLPCMLHSLSSCFMKASHLGLHASEWVLSNWSSCFILLTLTFSELVPVILDVFLLVL